MQENKHSVEKADSNMDEEVRSKQSSTPEPILLCKCLLDVDSSEKIIVPPRKKLILSTVARTEEYLRERRIPELIRFLLTKVIAHSPSHPIGFLETLLDDCMLYRAGHGQPPVLYEARHLQAVVKSFDPGNRGWLSSGQVRRAFNTLGLTPANNLEDRIPTDVVLDNLRKTQEHELYKLLKSGTETDSRASMDDLVPNNESIYQSNKSDSVQ